MCVCVPGDGNPVLRCVSEPHHFLHPVAVCVAFPESLLYRYSHLHPNAQCVCEPPGRADALLSAVVLVRAFLIRGGPLYATSSPTSLLCIST